MKAHTINRSRTRRWGAWNRYLLLPMAAAGIFTSICQAASYIFTNIADSSGIFAPTEPMSGIGNGFLSINNFGVVAFGSGLDDGSFGVFKGNGGPVTPIALSSGPVFNLVGGASINDTGNVAFFGQFDAGGQGIFTGNGGPIITIVTTSAGFTGFGLPRMNDSGRIAFIAGVSQSNNGLFLRGAGSDTTVALESGPTFSSIADFSINSFGTVAFHAALKSGAIGVFTGNGGPITTIAQTPVPQGITPSINDLSTVAFTANSVSSMAKRILTSNGGPLTTYVSDNGPFNAFGKYPVINNSGTVAFLGGLDILTTVGIFTGADTIADKVILNNEPLFGSTVVNFSPGNIESPGAMDINDSGQIAFHYQLADGRQGIAVATPVPEPQTAVGLVIGALALGLTRWKNHGWKIA